MENEALSTHRGPSVANRMTSWSVTLGAVCLRLLLSLLLLVLHVAVVHDGSYQLVNAVFLLLGETQHIKCILNKIQPADHRQTRRSTLQ